MKEHNKYFLGISVVIIGVILVAFDYKYFRIGNRAGLIDFKSDSKENKSIGIENKGIVKEKAKEAEISNRLGTIERNVVTLVNKVGLIEKLLTIKSKKEMDSSHFDPYANYSRPLPSMSHELVSKFPVSSQSNKNLKSINDADQNTKKSSLDNQMVAIRHFGSMNDLIKFGDNLAKNNKDFKDTSIDKKIITLSEMINKGKGALEKEKLDLFHDKKDTKRIKESSSSNEMYNANSMQPSILTLDMSKIQGNDVQSVVKDANSMQPSILSLDMSKIQGNDVQSVVKDAKDISVQSSTASKTKSKINVTEDKIKKIGEHNDQLLDSIPFFNNVSSNENIKISKPVFNEVSIKSKIMPFCENLASPEESFDQKKCIFSNYENYYMERLNQKAHNKMVKNLKGVISDNLILNNANMENSGPNKLVNEAVTHIENLKDQIKTLQKKIDNLTLNKNKSKEIIDQSYKSPDSDSKNLKTVINQDESKHNQEKTQEKSNDLLKSLNPISNSDEIIKKGEELANEILKGKTVDDLTSKNKEGQIKKNVDEHSHFEDDSNSSSSSSNYPPLEIKVTENKSKITSNTLSGDKERSFLTGHKSSHLKKKSEDKK